MSRRSHRHQSGPMRRMLRRHGQTIGVCIVVVLVVVMVGLLIWFMSDVRFRSRRAYLQQLLPDVVMLAARNAEASG